MFLETLFKLGPGYIAKCVWYHLAHGNRQDFARELVKKMEVGPYVRELQF